MVAGRPEKPIEWDTFEKLCKIQCTQGEIAAFLEINVDTLHDRAKKKYNEKYSDVYKKFSEGGKCSLRRTQWKMAEKSCAMAIWLGKQYLGQKDHHDVPILPPHQDNIDKDHLLMKKDHMIAELTEKLNAYQLQAK